MGERTFVEGRIKKSGENARENKKCWPLPRMRAQPHFPERYATGDVIKGESIAVSQITSTRIYDTESRDEQRERKIARRPLVLATLRRMV